MSRIKAKDTKPEMLVRIFLHALGFRYRLHVNELPGRPDLVFPKYRTVIFVHGCFWHRHNGCRKSALPKTRTEWWKKKLDKNTDRDKKAISTLQKLGWTVIILWECELEISTRESILTMLANSLSKGTTIKSQL